MAKKIQDELQEQQIRCHWCVGIVPNKVSDFDKYVDYNGSFDPWQSGLVQWLLDKPFDGDWEVQTE